jgi:hypothetical protein
MTGILWLHFILRVWVFRPLARYVVKIAEMRLATSRIDLDTSVL